jgi:predicted GIY-YIG superfamily endonuclease
MKPFFVYILLCADDTYYVGHTDDLEMRMAQHHAATFAGYTSSRLPVSLVWFDEMPTRQEAWEREQQLKGWSRAKKDALIRGDWTALQRNAKRPSRQRSD